MIQTLWSLDQQFQNKNGSILTHGKIYVYYQGRTALADTYADEDGIALNTNPIILDNNGRAPCFVSTMYAYTVVVCDPYGNELFSYDITLHDVVDVAEKVLVLGTDGTVLVDTTTLPNGVQYDLSVNTDIIATNETVSGVSSVLNSKIDVVEGNVQSVCAALDGKKDKQATKSYNGSQTKTITNISQDANGVITVTYDDIDLPPEVPNVEIVSPNDTISVSATTDTSTNTKTFSIDVKNDQMQHFIGYYGNSRYEDRSPSTTDAYWLYVNSWSSYDYVGDFITNNWQANNNPWFYVKPGLYYVHAVVTYTMKSADGASKSNNDGYIRIATGYRNGLEDGTRYKDWSHEYQLDENSIEISFVRKVTTAENNGGIEIAPYLPYGVNWACIHELQIVKLDSVVGNSGGGSGTDYIFNSPLQVYDSNKVRLNYSTDTFTVDSLGNLQFVPGHALGKVDGLMSVLVNPASGIDIVDNQLVVKVGEGLSIDPVSGVIAINTEVGDVVQTVEKLKQDLDTQLTVNFDMPNVDNVYDFADPSVIGMSNGAVMLCQAFTVPINHDIRVDDGVTENPTLVGIYAKQAFTGKKIMLALYVYDFDTGYTDYVGDTGPVEVTQGRNEFSLKHINPNISELKSSCVYYASLYLPSNAHSNGLYLAGCPSYSNASYINATPRFTVGVQNIVNPNTNHEIDMTDATTGRLDFNDGNGNYYIGPWSDNYNERPSIPRFFMQIRNGEVEEPVVVEPFTDIGTYTLKNTDSISSVFGSSVNVNTSTYGAVFMEVTPAQDVDVTGWVCYDNYATDDRQWYGNVFDSSFENQLSAQSNGTLVELGETSTGSGIYGHEFTRTSPLHLTANTTYRFLVGIPRTDNDLLVQYNTPTVSKNLHLFASGYNVSQWVTYSRANNVQGIDFVIKDANHEWRI